MQKYSTVFWTGLWVVFNSLNPLFSTPRKDNWVASMAGYCTQETQAARDRWERNATAGLKTHLSTPGLEKYSALIVMGHADVPGMDSARKIRDKSFEAWKSTLASRDQRSSIASKVLDEKVIPGDKWGSIYSLVMLTFARPTEVQKIIEGNSSIVWAGAGSTAGSASEMEAGAKKLVESVETATSAPKI